tara:strand:- start:455 stop:829 length:375 start_codon:yes stop_codon:yes gene_type:complete
MPGFLIPLAALGVGAVATAAGGYLLFKEDGTVETVTDEIARDLVTKGEAALQSLTSQVGGLTLSFINGLGSAVVTGLDNAYDAIKEKLGLNTENVVAAITMGGLTVFTVVYLYGAAKRGTMALE